jgi:hypothetical protein
MNWNRITLGILPLALLAAVPLRADDKPVTLSRAFKKGDVIRMKIETLIDGNAGGAQVKLTSKSMVKEVKENGQVVVELQDEAGKLTLNGSDMDIPAGPITTLTYDKAGKLIDFKSEDGGVITPVTARQLEIMRMPILVEREVKAGDSWESEFDNPALKGKKFNVKTTFLGLDKLDGVDLWKVQQKGAPEIDSIGAKMGFEATYWLDPASGQTVRADVKITDEPTTQYGTHSLTTKVTRIKAETK